MSEEKSNEELRTERDQAYWERNQLVCAISKLFPSYIGIDDGETDLDWRYVVYVQLPTGQVSWHVHRREIDHDFKHLPKATGWDGHTTQEKYSRLREIQGVRS